MSMKRIYFLLSFLFLLTGFEATAQDYVLIPENFFLHKGDKLNVHLISANQFMKQDEIKYETANVAKFILYNGSKKTDLAPMAKDTAAPIVSFQVENEGLTLYGKFHSDKWGNFKTYFKFHINSSNKIYRLEIGQADY